jgi:hypothetical protein
MFQNIDDSNFMLYAAKNYNSPSCTSESEFLEDIARIKNVSRILSRYAKTGELNERLVLNHLIILYNVFDHVALTRMLAFKMGNHLHRLKPFLILIGYWPERIEGVDGQTIIGTDVSMDQKIIEKLRKI